MAAERTVEFREVDDGPPMALVSRRPDHVSSADLTIDLRTNGPSFARPDRTAWWPPAPTADLHVHHHPTGRIQTVGLFPQEVTVKVTCNRDGRELQYIDIAQPMVSASVDAVAFHALLAGEMSPGEVIEFAGFSYCSLGELAWLVGLILETIPQSISRQEAHLHRQIATLAASSRAGRVLQE